MYEKKLKAIDRLIQARIHLQKEKPFFSYLTMHLNFIEATEEDGIPTMGITADGDVYYNAGFVEGLDEQTCKGVLCHEVMHCALEHLLRRNNRHMELWNICNDAVINNIIAQEGMKLPKDGVIPYNNEITIYDTKIKKINDKSSEEVFDETYGNIKKRMDKVNKSIKDYIKNHPDAGKGFDKHIEGDGNKNGKDKSDGSGGNQKNKGKGKIPGKINPAGGGKDKKNWKKILIDACTHAKQQGHLPAGMERIVGKILETHIDWKGLLYRYITNQIPIDYNWCRPSKKSFSTGVYLPSVEKEKIDVIVAIDTSGSISQEELSQFMSEIISILRTFRNVDLTIIDCDAQINSAKTYKSAKVDDALEFKLRGGGGTSHLPVFKWIDKHMSTARLLVAFTDGYTSFPEVEDVNINTLWVVAGNWRADVSAFPFGEVIELPKKRD